MAAITELITQSGQTVYCTIHDNAAKLANGSSTEVFNSSNWSTYVNTLAEQGTTGYYTGTFPSYLAAGKYTVVFYQQSGGSATVGDPVIGSGQIYFDGSIEEQGIAKVLSVNTMPELSSVPGATPTVYQALMFAFMALKNAHTATAGQEKIQNNAGTTVATATLSDDGITFTKGKFS